MADRFLTSGERQMISAMFGSSISLDGIKISDQPVVLFQDVPVTPTGQTIFWPTDLAGRAYSNDFSTSDLQMQALFLHTAFGSGR
jgi:hypothetical protein